MEARSRDDELRRTKMELRAMRLVHKLTVDIDISFVRYQVEVFCNVFSQLIVHKIFEPRTRYYMGRLNIKLKWGVVESGYCKWKNKHM